MDMVLAIAFLFLMFCGFVDGRHYCGDHNVLDTWSRLKGAPGGDD